MARIRVGILFGGRSAEHEVSILSARNVVAALDRERFDPVLIGIGRDGRWRLQDEEHLLESSRDPRLVHLSEGETVSLATLPAELPTAGGPIDVVFPLLHGPMGEDGTVQGLLELAGIPYVGCRRPRVCGRHGQGRRQAAPASCRHPGRGVSGRAEG